MIPILTSTRMTGTRTPFSPSSLTGLWAWYEARRLTGLVADDRVSSFTDLSGNGRHATAAGAARPYYRTNVINGLPAIEFVPDACILTMPVFTSVELFIVICGYNRSDSLWLGSSANGAHYLYSSDGSGRFAQPSGGYFDTSSAAINTWFIVEGQRTAAGVSKYVWNGTAGATATDTGAASLDALGYPALASFNIDGFITGAALYTTVPSATDMTRLRRYFADQVGVTVV